jgi:hypothetical protein
LLGDDWALFGKWSGTEIQLEGENLLIMKESGVMGIPGALHHGRLGGQGQRSAGAADRRAAQPCLCRRPAARRWHAGPRAGAGPRQTKAGRLWTYVRDGRPCADQAPPAVCYFYSPDRKGEHPRAHLQTFRGILHADGYAGFKELYEARKAGEAPAIQEAACMAHVRRKFFDLTNQPGAVAEEALRRIGELHDIEKSIRGSPPERRLAVRQIRHRGGHPLCPGALAGARPLHRWRHRRDRQQCRRALDPAHCIGRKNWLFAGSDKGGERAAGILSLIETAKLSGIDSEAISVLSLPRSPTIRSPGSTNFCHGSLEAAL